MDYYYTVEQMLELIDEPNRSACKRIAGENKALFQRVQGSSHNHQAWPGGYWDHVQEIMNIVVVLYHQLGVLRPLPFSLSDALVVTFLHDIEKPWKYQIGTDGGLEYIESMRTKSAAHEFRARKLAEYGIVLTPEQENGMRYVEGEFDEYSNKRRAMRPLAALCHMADVWSARGWFDYPMSSQDPWHGAARFRN